jgi:hypothetical protein
MPKNIVLFSDGTGNSSKAVFKTNVWRLYQALDLSAPGQVAYYDDGVGTSSFKPYAILGGAIGLGLKRNIKHIYAFLSRNYRPGDRIYGFGFSRGAFTMRILIGLVHNQGLAHGATEAELWRDVDRKWWAYRKGARTKVLGKVRTLLFGKSRVSHDQAADPNVKFTFVGLWDTVNAYGLPIDELTRAWDHYIWPLSMNDRFPCGSIEKTFHALSIDDERNTFHPVLWTEEREPQNAVSANLNDERISQVWFAGVHSNVGGSYPDDSLAHVPLYWIMNEARRRGLSFQYGKLPRTEVSAVTKGPIYDSRRGVSGYYRYNPRKIAKLIKDAYHGVLIARPKIHENVFDRMISGNDRYAPIILPEHYAVVQANGSIVNAAVESPSQSQARAVEQERAWNWVWARRVVYFAAVLSSFYLALFPLLFKDGACASNVFCFFNLPITIVGSFLPAFAAPWIDTFKANPGRFLLIASFIVACLLTGGWLSRKIRDTMRLIWNPILAAPRAAVPPGRPPSGVIAGSIYWLRTRRAYEGFFRWLTRRFLPVLFALAIYYTGAATVSRLTFSVFSAAGGVCAPSDQTRPVQGDTPPTKFDPKNPCAATGYKLQEGARYRIWIDTSEGWADKGFKADVEGFSTGWLYGAIPFRRWIAQPWFKPIARIGAHGNDEYPLDPLVPFAENEPKRRLATEIQARRSDELFLYVNDAVFFWPWWHTYNNNKGAATVKIQRIEAPPMPK